MMKGLLPWLLLLPFSVSAINVGTLTFAMDQHQTFVSKRVLNNNKSARIYQVAIRAVDRPGEQEVRSRPADGEMLYAPKQLMLQAGQDEYYKFFYHGPQDNRERYYRISFREIPASYFDVSQRSRNGARLEPVVVMDTILVVRPRKINFAYQLDKTGGSLSNTGNTYFKLLIKPGCDSSDEDGRSYYLRPGDRLTEKTLSLRGQKFIIYNDRFINIDRSCEQ
ncbi:hypothetical protein HMPREF0758_4635 [Serratia odorifera DSM 4582]|jgi:Mat/Ecp fimbriae periplasmic chaperone|uniref:Pili assembly chaperone N-terminal domain-containing protein n=3 Tax=Serratia odorifera TaxID=618 RepID=D4E8Y5_SEROD|nr:hypothetical protein HMPREF0758_4635 [Serratia odorifera DSM 4582]